MASDQWYGAEAVSFRIRADDDNTYVLGHNETQMNGRWNRFVRPAVLAQFNPHVDPV